MQIIEILNYVEENKDSAFFYTPNIYKGGKSYLFKIPFKVLSAKTEEEVNSVFSQIDDFSKDYNIIGFGTIPYEIGYYFQPKKIKDFNFPLNELKFSFYERKDVEIIESGDLEFAGVEEKISKYRSIDNLQLEISKNEYLEKVEKIKDYIHRGDTYQINFTTKAHFTFNEDVKSLFLNGIFNQSASYSAFINNGEEYILSFSPELFFKTDYNKIVAKPMKGTIKRKGNPHEDLKLIEALLHDEKNLAENVMIVDLMRNDIGRIAEIDSVKVDKLYEVEKYETLFQLTSTVSGMLQEKKISKIFKNLFPSGSITGAPKIRSMRIIGELEKSSRNLYTGSIGIISQNEAVFNIPIRTISINKNTKRGELGLGSGIVWDSDAESEFEEVLLKGKFISKPQQYFELLETMLFENGKIFLLDYHIERLKKVSEYFLFNFDEKIILQNITDYVSEFEKTCSYKLRLLLNKWGNVKIEASKISLEYNTIKAILCSANRCDQEKFIFHKTTLRPWDKIFNEVKEKGFDEVIFINERNEVLEGAISNIIIKQNGKYYTPPIKLKILNGCYRQNLIDSGKCEEKIIKVDELKSAEKVILCNSVRKELEVRHIFDENNNLIFCCN